MSSSIILTTLADRYILILTLEVTLPNDLPCWDTRNPEQRKPFVSSLCWVCISMSRQEAIAYLRRAAMDLTGGKLPSQQDEFLEGLTYQAYFALPEASQDALWERIFAEEKTGPYDLEEHDARPEARVAAR